MSTASGFGGGGGRAGGGRAQSVLLVEPDASISADIARVLQDAGATCRACPDAEAGWRAFAAERPDLVLTTINTPRRDAAWLLRRMHEDYLGALPPIFALCDQGEVAPALRDLELDGVVMRPLPADALRALAAGPAPAADPERQAARLRDLFDLSLLGDDLDAALTNFVDRVALNFRVADCVLWGPPHEGRWPKTRRPPGRPEEQAFLLWRCDLALAAGTTLIVGEGASAVTEGVVGWAPARSVLAAPIDAPGARALGALCLVDDGARCFTSDERDALAMVARRLARELAFRAAHDRLAEAYVDLRENAQRDPMTGALSSTSFVDELGDELARASADAPVAVAVVDVVELRHINERYGHALGDAALQHVASLAERTLAGLGAVGRVGGDELAVLVRGETARAAQLRLESLRRAVADNPVRGHGIDIPVRVRAGVTTGVPAEGADAALARAQSALAEARRVRAHAVVLEPGETPAPSSSSLADGTGLEDLGEDSSILPAGATLGGMYQILHEISRGAMGVVYRAEDLGLGRPVAIKVLRADLAQDADLVQRFREEAALLANLRHENLVQVYAFGAREHDVYFVMELVEGESLADLMTRADEEGQPIATETVASIVSQVAGALDAMHRAGAVHRDVKPANILLDRGRDRAVLVDVGVAKRRGGPGDAAGTPGFAAPESFTQGEEGPATDVYGLAATTYMMLTNLAPFGGGDVTKVIRRQLGDRPAAPSALREELAEGVDRVLLRALAPGPRDRYAGAIEFSHALGHALSEPPEERTTPGPGPGLAVGTAPRPAAALPPELMSAAEILQQGTRKMAKPVAAEAGSPLAEGQSRGALFRVAYKILGNRLGSAWVRRAIEEDPRLAQVLRPTVASLGWYPTELLVALLRAVPAGVRDPRKVARELGRATMTYTFSRFFGADPASLSPDDVLAAVEHYWSQYHGWGRVHADATTGGTRVRILETPRDPLLCCMIEGTLERIAELAGAAGAQARHVRCEVQGAGECEFEVRWDRAEFAQPRA